MPDKHHFSWLITACIVHITNTRQKAKSCPGYGLIAINAEVPLLQPFYLIYFRFLMAHFSSIDSQKRTLRQKCMTFVTLNQSIFMFSYTKWSALWKISQAVPLRSLTFSACALNPFPSRKTQCFLWQQNPSHPWESSVCACSVCPQCWPATGRLAKRLKSSTIVSDSQSPVCVWCCLSNKSKQWHSMACNCIHCWPLQM